MRTILACSPVHRTRYAARYRGSACVVEKSWTVRESATNRAIGMLYAVAPRREWRAWRVLVTPA